MVKFFFRLDHILRKAENFGDPLGSGECSPGRARYHKVGMDLALLKSFAHAGRVTFSTLVQGTLEVIQIGVIPTGLCMTDNVQGFHA